MEGMSSWGNADKEPTKQIQLTPEIVTQDSTKVDQHLAEALLKVNEEKLTHDKANAVDTIRELTKLSKLDNTFEEVRNNAVYQLDHLARTFRGAVIKIPSSEIYRKLQSQNLTLEESQSRYALAFPGYRFSDDMSYITHIPYKGYTIQLHTPVSTAKYMSGECLLALKHDDDSREGSGVVFTALNADTPEFIIRWLQRGRSEDSVFQDDTIDQSAQPDISTEILEFQPTEVLPPQYQVEKRQSRWRRITQKIGVGLATILVGLNINLKNAYTPTQPSSETQPSSTIEYVTPESVIEAPRTRKSPVHTEVNPDFTQLETGESLRSEIQKYLGNEATEADIDTFQRLYLATDTGRNTIWKLSQLTEQGRIYAQELGIQSPDALSLDQLSILANHLGTGELFGFAEVDFLSEHEPHKMDRQEMRAFLENQVFGADLVLNGTTRPLEAVQLYCDSIFGTGAYDTTIAKAIMDDYILNNPEGRIWLYHSIWDNPQVSLEVQQIKEEWRKSGIQRPDDLYQIIQKQGTANFWAKWSRYVGPGTMKGIGRSLQSVLQHNS